MGLYLQALLVKLKEDLPPCVAQRATSWENLVWWAEPPCEIIRKRTDPGT